MKKNLIYCLILLIFASPTMAQKIEIVHKNESIYLVDKSGKTSKTVQYFNLYPCSNSQDWLIAEADNIILVNLLTAKTLDLDETTEYLKIEGDSCSLGSQDFIRFKSKKKIGLINFPDKIILPAEYDEIIPQADTRRYFIVKKAKNYQFFYPQTNKFSKPFQMAKSTNLYLDNGLCYLPEKDVFFAMADGNPCVMKTDGTQYLLDKYYANGVDLNEGGLSSIPCSQNGKYGFIDAYANIVIPFKYDEVKTLDYLFVVKYDEKYGVINESGNIIVPYAYDKIEFDKLSFLKATKQGKTVSFIEGGYLIDQLMVVAENNKFGFATEDQTIKIACDYEAALEFRPNTAAVKKGGKWGYILPTGHTLIDFRFQDAQSFQNYGLAPVKLNGKWGFIDYEGKFVYEPTYDSVKISEDLTCRLFKNGGIYILGIDKKISLLYLQTKKENYIDSRDGRTYQTVKIGEQTWMAQNLDYKTDESYYYENKPEYGASRGLLYTWKAALTACPAGWYLPSDADWQILEKTLGMPELELNSTDYSRGSNQAASLKMGGSSGFDVVMSGFKHGYDNNFYKLDDNCILWTSTPSEEGFAVTRTFFSNSNMLNRDKNTYVKYALPVRCVKD